MSDTRGPTAPDPRREVKWRTRDWRVLWTMLGSSGTFWDIDIKALKGFPQPEMEMVILDSMIQLLSDGRWTSDIWSSEVIFSLWFLKITFIRSHFEAGHKLMWLPGWVECEVMENRNVYTQLEGQEFDSSRATQVTHLSDGLSPGLG